MKAKKNEVKLETMEEVLDEMYDGDYPEMTQAPNINSGMNSLSPQEYELYMKGTMFAVYEKLRDALGSGDSTMVREAYLKIGNYVSEKWNVYSAQHFFLKKRFAGQKPTKRDFLADFERETNPVPPPSKATL